MKKHSAYFTTNLENFLSAIVSTQTRAGDGKNSAQLVVALENASILWLSLIEDFL